MEEEEHILQAREVKLRPTAHGFRFLGIWLILLAVSMSYQNSLGYIFAFSLISISLISIIHTYRNLTGLKIKIGRITPVFAEQDLYFRLIISNLDDRPKDTVRVQWQDGKRVSFSLGPYQEKIIEVPIYAPKRGILKPGSFKIFTQFPFGIIAAKTTIHVSKECIIYPKPADKYSFDIKAFEGEHGDEHATEGTEDFAGLRKYHPGDSLKHIAWKALARGQEVLTKQFFNPVSSTVWLNWDETKNIPIETQLSQFCRAILEEEQHGNTYGINLPNLCIAPHAGEQHKHDCLRALALYQSGSTP